MRRRAPLAFLVALFCLLPGLAVASPEGVLRDESASLRDFVLDADGLAERMERYRDFAGPVQELSETLEAWRPLIDELRALGSSDELALLSLLAELEPSLAVIRPLAESMVAATDILDTLSRFGKSMLVFSSDFERLLSTEVLTVDDLTSLRSGIGGARDAIRETAQAYGTIRPSVDEAMKQLDQLQVQLDAGLAPVQELLGPDLTRQLSGLLGGGFAELRTLKAGMDELADHADSDIARLGELETRTINAEAHHAFALAEEQVSLGDIDAAEHALELLILTYPETPWADTARDRLERGLASSSLQSDRGDASSALWIAFLVLVGLVVIGVASVFGHRYLRSRSTPSEA